MKKKITTILLVIAVICLTVCMFTGCARKNENILSTSGKGEFFYTDISELEKDFSLVYGSSADKNSVFKLIEIDDEDENSAYELKINTTSSSSEGYAALQQKINLNAGCYYTVTYEIAIGSMERYNADEGNDGVFFTILEDKSFNYTDAATDFHQETTTGEKTFKYSFLSKESGEYTAALCVGTKDCPVKAEVDVYSFNICRVSKSEAIHNFDKDANVFVSDIYGGIKLFNVFYIVMGAFFIVALSAVAYTMFRRHMALSSEEQIALGRGYKNAFLLKLEKDPKIAIILFAAIGFVVRLLTDVIATAVAANHSTMILGYNVEGLAAQAVFISKYGPANLIKSLGGEFATDFGYTVMSVSSSPLQLYFLGFAGLFGRIFETITPTSGYIATVFFIRMFQSLADIVAAYFIYDLVKKNAGNIGGTIISTLYLCLPIVFATSSLWGYMDSITAALIVLTFWFMVEKNNYLGTAITFFAACMFSQTALFVAPIVLFYTVLTCIKDIKAGEYRTVIYAGSILVLSFFVFYALTAPFYINYIQDGTPFYCFKASWNELFTNAVYTFNAFNFQALLGNNNMPVTTASLVVTIIFIVFMLSMIGLAYFKFKNRMNLMLLATAFINMMFVFANNMNPVSVYVSLALMLIYAIMNKEKRIFFSFVVFAALAFINISYTELFVTYTSSSMGLFAEKSAVMYVFSAISLAFVLYYIYIVYDIVVSRKVRKISPLNLPVLSSVRNVGLRIIKKFYGIKSKFAR